jgi:hypothetical protein
MPFPIITAVLVGVITLLSWLLVKILAVLVGALLAFFCPVLFLIFLAGTVTYINRRRIMRRIGATRRDR